MAKTAGAENQVKALEMLKNSKSIGERAENYIVSAKRNIQRDVIDAIISRKEAMEDKLFDLSDFTLETNGLINAGVERMNKDAVENRFKQIIDLEYQLKLLKLELETKQASFSKYFGTNE